MIKLQNVAVSFEDRIVLDDLSLTVEKGDFITIVGANGVGKSTLFDVLTKAIIPLSGLIAFDNCKHKNKGNRPIISRLFQNPSINCVSSMTVAENLAMATYRGRGVGLRCGMKQLPKKFIGEVFENLDIDWTSIASISMGKLSGGQRQLISLIMLLIDPPDLLLLDEPTAALDPQASKNIIKVINNFVFQHGITTLLITHDPFIAQTVGNKLWILEKGTIKMQLGAEKRMLSLQAMRALVS